MEVPDIRSMKWLHANIAEWPETSQITAVRFGDAFLEVCHTKAGKWTATGDPLVEGNPWVVAKVDDRWYAATYEWLRPGQTKKGITGDTIGPHTKRAPLSDWRPRPGELVGFIVSTPARDDVRTSNERSQIAWVLWGDGTILSVDEPHEPPVEPPVEPPPATVAEDVRAIRVLLERVASRFGL